MAQSPRTKHSILAVSTIGCAAFASASLSQITNQDHKLLASSGAADDEFGTSIAINMGVVAVGSYRDDDNGTDSGSVCLFVASTGNQFATLLSSDGEPGDLFGWAVDIGDNIVAVGAKQDDDNGGSSGSAYLFDASTGTQLFKLLPHDGATFDFFGNSIAIDAGIAAVGARLDDHSGTNSGSAYLFDALTGNQLFKLAPTDGASEDWFAFSIAIDNGIVAVGTLYDDDNGINSGSVYLFDTSSGLQISKLLPSDGAAGDLFGFSIAMSDGVIVVGASNDDDNGTSSGSAYLFEVATGTQIAKLVPKDNEALDSFGSTVDIDNGMVAIGAKWDDINGSSSGSAYIFDAKTGLQLAKLGPSDGIAGEWFGSSIAMSGGIAATGAIFGHDNGVTTGAAYLYDLNCKPDTNHDGAVTPADFTAWIAAFNANSPECDQNGDNSCTPADFTAWIANFNAGC